MDKEKPVNPIPGTPNPKPRKQSRRTTPSHHPTSPTRDRPASSHTSPPITSTSRQSTSPSKRPLLLSPHAHNPDADFIPPVPFHSRHLLSAHNRRSITPIPPYEPPRETFTPPREVLGTPIAKSNKRKQPTKRSGKQLKLVIKEEPPDLDLSLPLPPASPTEDPLLLAEQPGEKLDSKRSFERSQSNPSPAFSNFSQWEESPLSTGFAAADICDSSTSSDIQPRTDDIVFPPGEWSDSDDDGEEFNQSGEFTGKFTTIQVPTKADPPTSTTKDRQEAWGRPVSPFPYPNRRKSRWSSPIETGSPPHGHVLEHNLPGSDDDQDAMPLDQNYNPLLSQEDLYAAPSERTCAESTATFDAEHHDFSAAVPRKMNSLAGGTSQASAQPVFISTAVPSMLNFTDSFSPRKVNHSLHVAKASMDTHAQTGSPDKKAKHVDGPDNEASRARDVMHEEDDQFVAGEFSRDELVHGSGQSLEYANHGDDESVFQPGPDLSIEPTDNGETLEPSAIHDDSDASDEDEELDLGVIKISSEDPMAAARAAAILKMVRFIILSPYLFGPIPVCSIITTVCRRFLCAKDVLSLLLVR
jgi:hypothetical protein